MIMIDGSFLMINVLMVKVLMINLILKSANDFKLILMIGFLSADL